MNRSSSSASCAAPVARSRWPWKLPLLLLLAGCTVLGLPDEEYIGGYWWVKDPQAAQCGDVQWKQVARERIPGLCGDGATAARENVSCAIGCLVVSPFTEAQARSITLADGDTLYRHESRHVLEGLVHPVH